MSLNTNLSNQPPQQDTTVEHPQTVQDTLNVQLTKLDNMLEDPNCDHSRVLEQAYKILMLMSRLLGQTEKEYVLDQEPELYAQVKELKGTYNTWTVLAITIASGSLTIAGGFVGMGAAIPGTALGQTMGNAAPNALGWLSNADWAKKLANIGQGMGGVGQGTGAFGKLAGDSNEAKRSFCHIVIEEIKRKRSDRYDASQQMRNQSDAAANNCRQSAQASHSTAMQIMQATR